MYQPPLWMLARTKDEYQLILTIGNSFVDVNTETHYDEIKDLVVQHLARYRALPRSVDSYIEECPTGQNLSNPS